MTDSSNQARTATPGTSTLQKELAQEQAHVDLVYDRLEEATKSAEQVAAEGRALYQSDRSTFFREEDGTGLYERDVFAFQAAKRLAELEAETEGLVFGRLDRIDHEIRYIGRIGVRDAEYEPLVIDWRAPAAEPFYRATPANPMLIVRRRVLRSQGRHVVGIEDDLLDSDAAPDDMVVIGEGALMAALTRARGHQMRDIVATIQAEQDEAIRAPYPGVTMISGGPGTGKTVVALHRAAYLLYSNRRRFEVGGVLVVGPSTIFMRYIERVLPSLGEDSVTLRPIGAVASDVVRVRGERLDEPPAAAVKGSLRMARVLRRLVDEPASGLPDELSLTLHGEVLTLEAAALRRIRGEVLARHAYNQGGEAAEAALLTALWRRKYDKEDMERAEFDEAVRESPTFEAFLDQWWPPVSATATLARLADPSLVARIAVGMLSSGEQETLAGSFQVSDGEVEDPTTADAALLDELIHLLGPEPQPPREDSVVFANPDAEIAELVPIAERLWPTREVDPFATAQDTFAHILVDEAQDITPMQWRMLGRRGPQASWTIVGDPAQSSWPDPEEAATAMRSAVGSAHVRSFRLSTNYRSPAEVFDLAAAVVIEAVPEADLPIAVRSTGIEPELLVAEESMLLEHAVEQIARLLQQVEGTVAAIAPPSRHADLVEAAQQAGLGDEDRLAFVTPLQAKGLEYDGVLVLTPDDIVAESPGGVRTLYVALTRPTQRLITLDAEPGAIWRKSLG